ncbi:TPA: tail fiber protein, partial [Escherichia coli]
RSASAAKTSETNAKASETRAESSKTAAASSASSAASSASSASASKDEATRQASAAKGSATTASTKATEAAGSATAASQSKTAAESAATRAEAAADRAEEIAGAVAMEDASLTTKGVVKLSSAVDSTSESLAATPKAVKVVNDNANSRVPFNRKINGKALTADITLTPKDIGTLNSITMSFSGGAGWFKLATVTMPQESSIVYIALIGGAGFNVGAPQQAGISELVLRAGNWNPKGITGALWKRTAVGLTNFAWINTSGDTYDIYVEIGNYATSVNIHWDCTANASVSIYTSPTYSASKPSSVTDGVVYTMYSTHQKPTPLDIGALPTTGGTVSGPLSVTGGITGTLNGNASTATKLQTARSIGGVVFDGSANINLPGVNTTGNQNTTGNAATATKLQTARTIGGVRFDGTANINLPGVNVAGNQNTSGNAATATKLQTARTINGVSFDGSKNIELTPRSIGTINSATMSFSGGAGWFKLATVTMPQASSVVYISLIGGAGFNVGAPQQAGISELVLRAGNWNPKGITGALWRRTSVGFTNFAWVNTSGDTYDIYVEIGNYATGVNIQWDYTSNASVTIHTSPSYTANKPTGLTDGTVYVIYSSHIKPTATDVGALPITGGNLNGGLTATGEIISKSANGLRIAYGNYGFFIRNDGSNTYFMLTDSGNSLGTYNSLRPLIINNANGAVTIANGLNVTGGVNGSLNGNASTATKLQTARKISGVSFDGSSDITLKASHVGAFALGQTGSRVANDKAVGWNWNSGVYDADISGATALILHFNMNVGSCPAVQFRVNYRNGGISYRSARDGYGFEEDWTPIYTKKDSIPGVNTTGNQNTTGNAATATKLQTARKIAGVAFDGSADITLTAANLNAYTKTEVTNLLSSYVKSSALPSMTVRTSSISGGDMGMSLSTFISHLKSNGAFSKRYWIGFGDAMGFNAGSINNITGFGAVELAESIIEVFNLPNGDYTIRLTTSHKADYGGVTNAILVYHYRSNRSPSGQWLKFAGTVGATSN